MNANDGDLLGKRSGAFGHSLHHRRARLLLLGAERRHRHRQSARVSRRVQCFGQLRLGRREPLGDRANLCAQLGADRVLQMRPG